MVQDSPLALRLDAETEEKIKLELLEWQLDAVSSAKNRDEELKNFDMLLDGKYLPLLSEPWPDSCDLVDQVVWIECIQLLAQVLQPLKRSPLVMIGSRRAEASGSARNQETWADDTMRNEGFHKAFYFFAFNCLRDKAGVLYSGWSDRKTRKRSLRYWDGHTLDPQGDKHLIEATQRDPEQAYRTIPVQQDGDEVPCGEHRCVDQADFYPFPANAASVEKATGTFERLWLSEQELLAGILDFGYDHDNVMEIIKSGPTHDMYGSMYKERQDRQSGVSGTIHKGGGTYECFLYFGLLPKLWNVDNDEITAELPKHYWNDMFQGMVCGPHKKWFKLDFCRLPRKPYFTQSLIPKNNNMSGTGIVEKLEPFAYEKTHLLRSMLNGVDYQLIPPMVMTPESKKLNKTVDIYPSAVLTEDQPGSIRILELGKSSLMALSAIQQVGQEASQVAANSDYGHVPPQQHHVIDMQSALGAVDQKFNLYQWNIYEQLPDIWQYRVELEMIFNPDIETEIQTPRGTIKVKADDLQGEYTYTVAQTSSDSNPDARRQKNEAVGKILTDYLTFSQQFPLNASNLWEVARTSLLDMDIRNVEDILGNEPPSAAEQQAIQQQNQQAMQQSAGQGGMPMPPQGMAGGAPQGGGFAPQSVGPSMNGKGHGGFNPQVVP